MSKDTKFKIIDTKLERDLIHYIWTRLLTLAGKVNVNKIGIKVTVEILCNLNENISVM